MIIRSVDDILSDLPANLPKRDGNVEEARITALENSLPEIKSIQIKDVDSHPEGKVI